MVDRLSDIPFCDPRIDRAEEAQEAFQTWTRGPAETQAQAEALLQKLALDSTYDGSQCTRNQVLSALGQGLSPE